MVIGKCRTKAIADAERNVLRPAWRGKLGVRYFWQSVKEDAMKYLDEMWKEWIGDAALSIIQTKIMWEDYIRTEKGAQEAVELMVALFFFSAIDGLWATWNLWRMLLSAIW